MWDTSQTAHYLHIKLVQQSPQGKKNLFSSTKTKQKQNEKKKRKKERNTDKVKHSLLLTKKIPLALILLSTIIL